MGMIGFLLVKNLIRGEYRNGFMAEKDYSVLRLEVKIFITFGNRKKIILKYALR